MSEFWESIVSWKGGMSEWSLALRVVLAWATALLLGFAVFRPFYSMMQRLKYGEVIRDGKDVAALHALHAGKKNTVTMGGLMILFSVTLSSLLWVSWDVYLLAALFVFLTFGAIGFADDFLKVTKRNKKGLNGKLKLLFQALVGVAVFAVLAANPATSGHIRELWLPLQNSAFMTDMPYWMAMILLVLVLIATSNTVNLTDGADGLAIGCSITSFVAFAVIAWLTGMSIGTVELNLNRIAGAQEITVLCAALLGGGLSFLWFNRHPARVFMGDTGSLSLGGVIGMVAFLVNQPLILVVIGGVFVIEGLSVILQVASFQTTGKRIFRMSPLHHHFEIAGWAEARVVTGFWVASICFAGVGVASVFM